MVRKTGRQSQKPLQKIRKAKTNDIVKYESTHGKESKMKRNWKKVFAQWVCPLAVLLIITGFLFGSFSQTMNNSIADSFEKEQVAVAEQYADRLERELAGIETAGELIAEASFGGATDETVTAVLASCVEATSLYEAVVCGPDGRALTHDGSVVDLTGAEYYEWITGLAAEAYHLTEDDGITGEEAMVFAIPSEDHTQSVLLYYPVRTIKSMISFGKEFDGGAFSALLDKKGSILLSTDADTAFLKNPSFWNNIDEDCKLEISQAKRGITEGKSGCAHLRAEGEARTVLYVSADSWTLAVGVDEAYMQKMEALYGRKLTSGLQRLALVVMAGIVLVVVHNYITGLKAMKGTKQLKEKADTDQLTGLGNKLATENRIREYMAENPESLAVMFVLDIDNFKKINDTMGHAFGDEVLRELGKHIGVNFRVTDIIGRTGGDEFTIFLKNLKDESNAVREARKLEYFFQHFQVGDYVKYSATASIGAAVFPADGADFETLYKAADAALYKAKKRGKNQLAFFDDRNGEG